MASATRATPIGQDQRLHVPKFDGWLLLSSLLLLLAGLMSLYSIARVPGNPNVFLRQLLNFALGLVPFAIFFFTDPRFWRRVAPVLYGFNILLLVGTIALGFKAGGAQRWIELGPIQFQPSEAAKLLTVLTLATFFANRKATIKQASTFFLSLLHVAIPAALIFIQPHLGATLVILVIWLSVALAANVPLKYITISGLALILAVTAAFMVPGVMKDYQKSRVVGLFQGQDDEQGKGFQTSRAQIAFGMGGVLGEGFGKGKQKSGNHIPEQETDFIFTVVGEEGGLIGSTMVLACFGFFFYRVWLTMLRATEPFYRMVAGGIYGLLMFHTFVNIGMLVGVVPVVGLWLPFMSYGGTALWLCMACVGVLLSIRRREKPVLF